MIQKRANLKDRKSTSYSYFSSERNFLKSKCSNSYSYFSSERNFLKSKCSQLTIFVILALVIVGVLIFLFYPKILPLFTTSNVEVFPETCIRKVVKTSLNETLMHGGDSSPSLYMRYNNFTINYLCYTSAWYKTCEMQVPFLKNFVEAQVSDDSFNEIKQCFETWQRKMVSSGAEVKITGSKTPSLRIMPEKVRVVFDATISVTQNGITRTYDSDNLVFNVDSGAYSLLILASSIQNYEARYGDALPELYMDFYPNIKVEKKRQSDGTKVYILTDKTTKEVLQFAIRSLAWPPGLAIV